MPVIHLDGPRAEGEREDLVSEADPEDGMSRRSTSRIIGTA
jgi:hypothetical protein